MAIKVGDKIRGSIGNLTFSIDPVTKDQVVRRKPKKRRKLNSPDLQTHLNLFTDIVRLSSHMTEAHRLGLHHHAQHEKLRTYNDFRSLNKDCFTPDGHIDYPHIVVSRGTVAKVYVSHAQVDDNGILRIDFDPYLGVTKAAPDDTLYLYVYSSALEEGFFLPPVLRRDGTLSAQLPAEWLHPEPGADAINLHLYAFLRDRKGLTSDTIYIPLQYRRLSFSQNSDSRTGLASV